MNRQQLVQKVEAAWAALKEGFAGLSEQQLIEPATLGEWSVKDILAHITIWEEEALHSLPLISADQPIPRYADAYGGIDAFNAQKIEQKQHLSLAEVLQQFDETHARLIAYLQTVPEEQIVRETRFRRRLRLDTYSHYLLHANALRSWRASKTAG